MAYYKDDKIFQKPLIFNGIVYWNPSDERLIAAGYQWIEDPQPSIQERLKQYENAVQNHIDKTAQEHGYDNSYTLCSYYNDKNEKFKQDADTFKNWRSDVWVFVNEMLEKFLKGELEVLPTIEQLIEMLPKIEWVSVQNQNQNQNQNQVNIQNQVIE